MKTIIKTSAKANKKECFKCFGVFLFLITTGLLLSVPLHRAPWQFEYAYLFFLGWFSWTFGEYMFHRFVWHSKRTNNRDSDSDKFNHMHHHQHPTDIKVPVFMRFVFVISSAVLITVSLFLHNYFTIVAGFLCGFPVYSFTHLLLHKKAGKLFFAKKVRYHIYHHCKQPDACFGISVTWWDDIFHSVPNKKENISQKIIDFYFGEKEHAATKVIVRSILFVVIIHACCFCAKAQEKVLLYDVIRSGNVIGYVHVVKKTENNTVLLNLESKVDTRFIFSYSNYIKETAVFQNGLMMYGSYYQKENGKETYKAVTWNGHYCTMESNGRSSGKMYSPVQSNYILLFCEAPRTLTKIFSTHYGKFINLEKISENKFKLTFPDGSNNFYYYENDICNRVDIERTLFTVHFILKK